MQIPILSGVFTDGGPDVRTQYPVNLIPVPLETGISGGYLRPADGLIQTGVGPGVTRGGIEWRGVCYRVMGPSLVSVAVDGTVTTIGTVSGAGDVTPVTMDFSFDRLAIAVSGQLWYYDESTLSQVTDVDLGVCVDMIFIDGYFMTTDGESLVVTELIDPTAVDPTKYGSSEINPDPVVALLRLRNEAWALNRNTIEGFDLVVGGVGFPFARIEGAQIQVGCIGTHACCVFNETIAFVGSAANSAPGIFLAANASARKISTAEIDRLLSTYTELELSQTFVETRNDNAHQHLYVHLIDRTLVFDAAASAALDVAVWSVLTSSVVGFSQYRGQHFVWAYDRWLVGDPGSTSVGEVSQTVSSHFGSVVRWEFGTTVLYNQSKGAIVNSLELVALTGRVAIGDDSPLISTSYSLDGLSWSQDHTISVGAVGDRLKRLMWWRQGMMRSLRMQRFRGDSTAHVSFARLEATLTPLEF